MNKKKALEKIASDIEKCRICKKDTSGKAVPGEGNPDADVMFLGEAPGKEEAKTGRPFVGRSGKLLRSLIVKIGLKEENVYITSPVKYLPDMGTPTKKMIIHGRKHLEKQIEVINPKIMVLLGRTAVEAVLDKVPKMNELHGKTIKEKGGTFFVTYHPAAALRATKNKKTLEEDFEKLKKLI